MSQQLKATHCLYYVTVHINVIPKTEPNPLKLKCYVASRRDTSYKKINCLLMLCSA